MTPCADRPELFFNPRQASAVVAQRICAACPLLQRCADATLADPASTDGVFASVLLPPLGSKYDQDRETALEQLQEVAATGRPAPLTRGRRVMNVWDAQVTQEHVIRMREVQGLAWERIAHLLGIGIAEARDTYSDYLAEISEEVA